MPAHMGTVDVLTHTILAGGTVAERRAVTFAGVQAGADAKVLGISKMAAIEGDALPLTLVGLVDMIAGANIARGDRVGSNANGLPIPIGAGNNPFGDALNAASAGERVTILIR